MVTRMLASIFKSILIICMGAMMLMGCRPQQSEYRDAQGNRLPATQPAHTAPPRTPAN
jgi:hypothetical protein